MVTRVGRVGFPQKNVWGKLGKTLGGNRFPPGFCWGKPEDMGKTWGKPLKMRNMLGETY